MNSITAVVGKGVMMKHFLTIIKWGSIVTVMSSFMGMIQGIYEYLTEEKVPHLVIIIPVIIFCLIMMWQEMDKE